MPAPTVDRTTANRPAPTALTGARLELHWLAQAIGAAADAFLDKTPDDSHSNAGWVGSSQALVGRPIGTGTRVALEVAGLSLGAIDADGRVAHRLSARGHTLEEMLAWLGERVSELAGVAPSHPLVVRDYDMPEHPVGEGGRFTMSDPPALQELARWYDTAASALGELAAATEHASEVRCWPHHFDLGGIILLDPTRDPGQAPQIGFGMSPGDRSYDEPYYYVTPWPIPDGTALPALAGGGHWHREGFTGAVLTGTAALADGRGAAEARLVRAFLRAAVAAGRAIVRH